MYDFKALLANPWRLLPFLSWIGKCKDPSTLTADVIAGITVALVLVPQSMAYASLAGLPPYYGLYASFLPGIVAALFGSSRQLATGPVAVVSLMTAAALEPLALTPDMYVAYAIALAMMVGIFQMMLGLLRLGVLVDFLSHPVVIGFTNAAAIIIATSQLSKIFGVVVEKG
jgi:SulP family sulfate permease